MDRYFIELLLEQVGKGNMTDDNCFSKRVWMHMTSLFNAKFKFQYEKDVLKNRNKTLRNLYKAIKSLLDQKGFNWDETRQMVTADNCVWDEYIKIHPDARSYRIKTIPYFSDLCLIYKNTFIEPRGNHVSPDAKVGEPEMGGLLDSLNSLATPANDMEQGNNVAEESSLSGENRAIKITEPSSVTEGAEVALHEIMIYENENEPPRTTMVVPVSTLSHRSRTYWQPPMDRYFIDLMLNQVKKGNHVDGIFRKQAWMEMITLFNSKFGFNYDIDVLKNRYKTLKRQYNVIKNLLELKGFFWDDSRQMVTADDCVWQDYIKANTDARQYMTRPVPYYKDLCVICRDLNADERESLSDHNAEPGVASESEDQVVEILPMEGSASQKNKRRLENPLNSTNPKKTRQTDDKDMAITLHETVSAVSCLLGSKEDEMDSLIENVVRAVQDLPDMDEDLVLDACDFLEDEKKAKTFLALDVKLRKKWLMRKLRPQ